MTQEQEFVKNAGIIKDTFGTPLGPETQSLNIRTKIKGKNDKYFALVKFSLLGKWKKLAWYFYDRQPDGQLGGMKARTTPYAYPTDWGNCVDLIDNFLTHKGEGVTIW